LCHGRAKVGSLGSIGKFGLRLVKFAAFQAIYRYRLVRFFFLKITKGKSFVRKVQGSRMYLDLGDEGISRDLALDGIRELESTKILGKFIRKGDVVADIGANIGYYALMEARIVGKDGLVYAIEPSPSNFRNLKKNIGMNDYGNLQAFELAIGDKKRKARMYMSSHSNLNSLVVQKNKKIERSIDIQLQTLDGFLKGRARPTFLRMDVEGYEYNIIKGSKELLGSKNRLVIFMEIHPHIMSRDKTGDLLKALKKNGFEVSAAFRCFTTPEMMVKSRKEFDYSGKGMDWFINDASFIAGKLGAFEMFFERK
jgi:FkbM family methyltransferase